MSVRVHRLRCGGGPHLARTLIHAGNHIGIAGSLLGVKMLFDKALSPEVDEDTCEQD